jgi:general secretion pathway protein J
VAITLLGMIMVMAYQGLRTGAHSAAQGEAAIERVNRLRLSQEFLRSQLARALPMTIEQDDMLGAVVFEGGPEVMRFVGPMPGYLSYGGPYVQTLTLARADGGGRKLLFDHRILQYGEDAGREPDPSSGRDPVELLAGIDDAEFSYLEPGESQDEEPEWVDEWREVDRLPLLVRIRLDMREDTRIQWPELVVAPRVEAVGGQGLQNRFGVDEPTFGPRRPSNDRGNRQ